MADESKKPPLGHRISAGLRLGGHWFGLALRVGFFLVLFAVVAPGQLEAVFADFGSDLDEPLPARARGHYKFFRDHLREPFEDYSELQVLVPNFKVVALSHMACGLTNVAEADPELKSEVGPLLREVVLRARSRQVSAYERDPVEVRGLDEHGLYLAHLNIILGCYRRTSGSDEFDGLHARVSRHLAALSTRDGDFHARSWPKSPKWPADQAALLCSLYLYDQLHGTDLSLEPIRGWLDYMQDRATDRDSGLHVSAVTDVSHAKVPRGCALSWSTLYMAQFAPDEAADLYDLYRRKCRRVVLGCGGFREWPEGYDGEMSADTGPVIFGAGAAATGLGAGPARIFKDYEVYAGIMRTASTAGLPSIVGLNRRYRLSPLLGEAILFHGETARCWYSSPPPTSYARETPFPTGPLLVLLLLAVYAALSARKLRRQIKLLRNEIAAQREERALWAAGRSPLDPPAADEPHPGDAADGGPGASPGGAAT
jgi:hypothetical protein